MIKDKVAVVTGAASGIGLAIAKALTAEGAKVVLVDINEEALKTVQGEIGGVYVKANLANLEENKTVIEKAVEAYGSVDILVNVAGIQSIHPIEDFPEDKWTFMIDLMLNSPFMLTKYSWPYMKKNNWGRVINLNSIHGLIASEFKSAYVTAKHGLTGFTRVAAMEGGPYGITVNSINPSYVRTPLVDKQIADQAKNHGISEEEVVTKVMLAKAARKQLLEPEEIAKVCLFLCSDTCDMVTGTSFSIDGGWVIN